MNLPPGPRQKSPNEEANTTKESKKIRPLPQPPTGKPAGPPAATLLPQVFEAGKNDGLRLTRARFGVHRVRKVVRGQGQKFADLVRGQSQKIS